MFFFRRLITLSFVSSLLVFSSASWAMIDTIDSIEEIKRKVQSLRKEGVNADEMCVVWDFHGVLTKQATHQLPLTLNDNVVNTLEYLKENNIPNVMATAWHNFNAVISEGIIPLGLKDFFDVNPRNAFLQDFEISADGRRISGYRNGNVFALKDNDRDSETTYFPRKAFAVELAYPHNKFRCILVVEDSLGNLNKFRKDSLYMKHTENPDFESLLFYHFKKN